MQETHSLYAGLFDPSQLENLFQEHESFIGVPFQEGAIGELYTKFMRLKQILREEESITPFQVLRQLEPVLGERYGGALSARGSILEKVKAADGQFYGIGETTLSASTQLLLSYKIADKKEMRALIMTGKAYSPRQALEELERIEEQFSREELIKLQDGAGTESITCDAQLERILERINFERITQRGFETILKTLQGRNLRTLNLKRTSYLNLRSLRDNLKNITHIDLSGSGPVDSNILELLEEQTVNLHFLNLSQVKGLRKFARVSFFRADKPLEFANLKRLDLSEIPTLESVLINAPELRWFNLTNAAVLRNLKGKAPQLKHFQRAGTWSLRVEDLASFAELIRDEMSAYNIARIIHAVKSISDEEWPSVVTHTREFMRDGMSGDEIASIIDAVKGINDEEWPSVVTHTREFMRDGMDGDDIASIIHAVKGLSDEEWPSVVTHAREFMRDGMSAYTIAGIIHAVKVRIALGM